MVSARAHALDAGAHRESVDGDDGSGGWIPPVLATVATEGTGMTEVVTALDSHYEYLVKSGTLADRRRARLRERVKDVVEQKVQSRLWSDTGTLKWLDGELPALESGTRTPYDTAQELLERSGKLITGRQE